MEEFPTSIYIVQKSCYYSKKYGRQNNYPSYSKKEMEQNPSYCISYWFFYCFNLNITINFKTLNSFP